MLYPYRRSRLFDDFFDDEFFNDKSNQLMSADIRESDDGYVIDMNVPGYAKEDLTMQLEKGYLTITANKKTDDTSKDKDGKIIRQERFYGTCSRSFYVGEGIKEQDIKGSYKDGVLTIGIPKKDAKQVETKRYIPID